MKKKIMKKLFKIILVCIFIIVSKLNAQEWVNVHPVFDPPGNYNTYNGMFLNKINGWWVENFPGRAWYTSNGGVTWIKQLDSGDVWFRDIKFVDSLHGWIIGVTLPSPYVYFILITKDGGRNWNKYSTPVIGCLSFFDSLNGFAGGDSTLATTNGGVTWQAQTIEPGVRFVIMDIYFVDKKNGWAVGYSQRFSDAGIILSTTDGGKYWKINEHPSGVTGNAIYFTDSLHGFVVGSNRPYYNGVIKVTSDGGVTWKTHYLPCTPLNDVVFT
ncbi:MAG: hypothetical protein QME52_11270, partial [Bacteroidota bacterium]|nr:hypothetical protein [Bacteroidota bacterium]